MREPVPFRILHILASAGPGGAEILIRDLTSEMRARGHITAIAFVSHAAEVGNSPAFEAEFKDRLECASVEVLHLGHAGRRNPFYGAWKLYQTIRFFRPDVIHIHLEWGLVFRLLLGPFAPHDGVTVYTHHINKFRKGATLFRLLAWPVDGVVAISESNRKLLEKQVSAPVRYIPNAVALATSCDGRKRRKVPGAFQVLSVGQLYPQKDYPTLVETAWLIFDQRPDLAGKLVFQIAGDGPERGRLEALIRERGLQRHVSLLGTRSDVPDLMCKSDLLLMTSAYEGLPIALLEALHAGLPIVATSVGAVPEVVGHGDNGLLAPPGDATQLAAHVLAILSDPDLARRFSARSRQLAADYGIVQCAQRHLEFYQDLLENSRQPHWSR
jgi:glycosyltransferase involved in cell wall biosynthesis